MDIDTRSKYLRFAKACADAAVERTTDPKLREILVKVAAVLSECADASKQTTDPNVREILLKVLAHLRAAALSAAPGGSTPPKPRSPRRAA